MYYDFNTIAEEELKSLYRLAIARGQEAAASFQQAYGRNTPGDRIEFNFRTADFFNAEAADRDGFHEVSITSPTIYLLRTLFEVILQHSGVMPEVRLPRIRKEDRITKVPFMIAPQQFAKVRKYSATTDPNRLRAAGILADFCSSFITLHELGHVIFGHTKYARLHYGDLRLMELYGHGDKIVAHYSTLQSWEYDADAVAGRLIVQYIETFANLVRNDPSLNAVFGGLDHDGNLIERCASLVTISLNVMFTYMAQAIVKLNKYASHPHPLFRASYTKDFIMHSLDERGTADIALIKQFNMHYYDQFADAMLSMRLLPYPTLTSELADDISRATRQIMERAHEVRQTHSQWSWVPADDWF